MLHSGENHSANFPFGHSVLVMISLCQADLQEGSQVPTTDEMQDACSWKEREQNEESRQARNTFFAVASSSRKHCGRKSMLCCSLFACLCKSIRSTTCGNCGRLVDVGGGSRNK